MVTSNYNYGMTDLSHHLSSSSSSKYSSSVLARLMATPSLEKLMLFEAMAVNVEYLEKFKFSTKGTKTVSFGQYLY